MGSLDDSIAATAADTWAMVGHERLIGGHGFAPNLHSIGAGASTGRGVD